MGACVCREKFSRDAPHLDEYFERRKDFLTGPVNTSLTEIAQLIEHLLDDEDDEKKKQLMLNMKQLTADEDKMKAPLKDIIRKSFDFHDLDKTGVINEEESQLFFQDFVERYLSMTCYCTNELLDKADANRLKKIEATLNGLPPSVISDAKSTFNKQVNARRSQVLAIFKARGDAYKADKDAKDKAAFAVLDGDGDGKLQKEEVVEGLFPDTDKNIEVSQALGLLTPAEVDQQKKFRVLRDKILSGTITKEDLSTQARSM
eukprot:gnl/TRDRNA2_/TRDRNA2_163278_c1_seq6.p1 gnl/TRDRNA2_/TRDRNA2_163278_c1~~gnl/TRDRNA2_/TRDRNA2_163278_c1_seq6.p1  ORF type:complete len:284 (+),score=64.35 gnl/TRDRNA2_/TRDRNA2_163278_c1_seq6:73-852(+)